MSRPYAPWTPCATCGALRHRGPSTLPLPGLTGRRRLTHSSAPEGYRLVHLVLRTDARASLESCAARAFTPISFAPSRIRKPEPREHPMRSTRQLLLAVMLLTAPTFAEAHNELMRSPRGLDTLLPVNAPSPLTPAPPAQKITVYTAKTVVTLDP